MLVLSCLSTAQASPEAERHLRDVEASLLHRRLDLSAVKRWQRVSGRWQLLDVPDQKLLVINLWSVNCKPCIAELPIFRRMVEAWKTQTSVQFLFVADPPSDTEEQELVAFWRSHADAVPDTDPCRSADEKLHNALEADQRPITLLVDDAMIVRQAFIGTIPQHTFATAIERLLRVTFKEPKRAWSKKLITKAQPLR